MNACSAKLSDIDQFFNFTDSSHSFTSLKTTVKSLCRKCSKLRRMISDSVENGFKLGIITNGYSKAHTNFKAKIIRISDKLLGAEATIGDKLHRQVLSIAYELINAKNRPQFNKIFDRAKTEDKENSQQFAEDVLALEAESQYTKASLALKFSKHDPAFIKPIKPKYLSILKKGQKEFQDKGVLLKKFQTEMIENGKLSRSGKPIVDHYKELYMTLRPEISPEQEISSERASPKGVPDVADLEK